MLESSYIRHLNSENMAHYLQQITSCCVKQDCESCPLFTGLNPCNESTIHLALTSIHKEAPPEPKRMTNKEYCDSINHQCHRCKFFDQLGSEAVKINVCVMKYCKIENDEYVD